MPRFTMPEREFASRGLTSAARAALMPDPHQPYRTIETGVNIVADLTESHVALGRLTDALFYSDLETGDQPTNSELASAIRKALKTRRTWNGCTRAVAAAFASDPVTSEQREMWCQQLAQDALRAVDLDLDLGIPSQL